MLFNSQDCYLKIVILDKNKNTGHKCKFWSKIVIPIKNLDSGQKLKFWSKI